MVSTRLRGLPARWLPRSNFGRAIALLAGGTALGHAIVVLASPVLSRVYSPADFGTLGVFAAVIQILSVVGTFRYELAVPLPEDDADAANLVLAGAIGTVGVTAGLVLLIPVAGPLLSPVAGLAPLRRYLLMVPVTLFLLGLYELAEAWVIRRRRFRQLAERSLGQAVAQVGTQVGMGFGGARPIGLLAGQALGYAAGAAWVGARVARDERGLFRRMSLPGAWAVARRYRRFPLYSSWSGLVNSAGLAVPVLLLAAFYGSSPAGWFALSSRVVGAPMALFGTAVAQVYLADASVLARTDRTSMRALFRRTARTMFLVSLAPLTVLALVGPWLFSAIFGAEWQEAGQYARVLAGMIVVQLVVVPVSQTLNVLERQDLQLAWDVFRLIVVTGSLVAAKALGWSSTAAVLAYSVAMVLTYGALYELARRALRTAI